MTQPQGGVRQPSFSSFSRNKGREKKAFFVKDLPVAGRPASRQKMPVSLSSAATARKGLTRSLIISFGGKFLWMIRIRLQIMDCVKPYFVATNISKLFSCYHHFSVLNDKTTKKVNKGDKLDNKTPIFCTNFEKCMLSKSTLRYLSLTMKY